MVRYMSKKKDRKKSEVPDYKAEVKHLRKENKELRARLEKIGRLAQDIPDGTDSDSPELLNEETADVDGAVEPIVIAKS